MDPAAADLPAPPSRLHRIAAPVLVALVPFAAFSPALSAEFLNYDDEPNFTNNEFYRGLSLDHLRWMFSHFDGHYEPLTWMTHGLDYLLFGMDPRGYHLVNLLLHSANAVLVFAVLLELLPHVPSLAKARGTVALWWAAAFGALFFAVHPLRVESVAWVTERRDVLFLLFALGSLLVYLRSLREPDCAGPRRAAIALSVGLFGLSMLSKAMCMTLPVLLLLLDVWPLRRVRCRGELIACLREKIPYFVIVVAGVAAEIAAGRGAGAFNPEGNYGLGDVLSQPAYRLSFYVWKTLAPVDLIPVYLLPLVRDPTAPIFLATAAGVAVVTLALVLLARRAPSPLVAWLAFALLLSPVLGLVQNSFSFAADRNTYFAGVVPGAVVAGALTWLWSRGRRPGEARAGAGIAAGAAAVLLLALLAGRSFQQSKVWHDSTTLWEHAVAIDPESYVTQYNLANALIAVGDLDRAIDHLNRAIWVRDDQAEFFYSRGRAWFRKKIFEHAIEDLDRALALDPTYWQALQARGASRNALQDFEGAIDDLSRAIELQPRVAFLYQSRALAWQALGNAENAQADLAKMRSLLEPR